MAAFISKVDIGNRALQHCGADRMGTLGFAEPSKRAAEISACYDQLREAELRSTTWVFAIKRAVLRAIATTTLLLQPSLWSSTITYYRGSIVTDQSGNVWISTIRGNLNNDPLLTRSYWEPYFGPLTVSLYDTTGTTAYSADELVYTYAGDGTNRVYLSLQSLNSDNPATAALWDPAVTYYKDQVITRSSVAYKSLIDLNLNQDPTLAPALWAVGTTYAAGARVGGSDGVIYQSIGSGNIGFDPTTDAGVHWTNTGVLNPWTTVFAGGAGSIKWLEIGGAEFASGVALTTLNTAYPIGAGPSTQNTTLNVFLLPASYFRMAAQNPKVPTAFLGGPSGYPYNDWRIENGYLVTAQTGPIVLRFVANVTDVRQMDPMFCEALAARIGMEVAQPITQSDARLKTIASEYQKWISDAKTANAIEASYEDPPDDEYLSVRL